jgi:hypothetical protein
MAPRVEVRRGGRRATAISILKNLVQSGWRDRAAMSSRAIEDRLFFICGRASGIARPLAAAGFLTI